MRTRRTTWRERLPALLYHAKWLGIVVPALLIWGVWEGGWLGWGIAGALGLALALWGGWMAAQAHRHGLSGYTLELPGATIRVLGAHEVPVEQDVRAVLVELATRWLASSSTRTDPWEVWDQMSVRYIRGEIYVSPDDPRGADLDPSGRYLPHPWHIVQAERDQLASSHTLSYEAGHPLMYAETAEGRRALHLRGEAPLEDDPGHLPRDVEDPLRYEHEWWEWREHQGLGPRRLEEEA